MNSKNDILKKIIERKQLLINERKLLLDITILKEKVYQKSISTILSFRDGLITKIKQDGLAIIAELKKASPSKGLLCPFYDPETLAKTYEQNGAACLSVLTEQEFFLGKDLDLETARRHTHLPILRKDFIVDPYQIYESSLIGADCILLIAAALSKKSLKEFYLLATEMGLQVLIEITDEEELETALQTDTKMIGINNRNLKNFEVQLEKSIQLSEKIPNDKLVICESGIQNRRDIELMQSSNINVFLVGEALVKAEQPGLKLRELLGKG
jgi:indole-3-glycerol phosphate synthase